MEVRAMSAEDLDVAAAVAARSFEMELPDHAARARWVQRVAYLLETDAAGSFVAHEAGAIVGMAQAMQRDDLWVLSLLAVDPDRQSAGAGRELLARTLDYGDADHGLIVSSNDPRALRAYARAGFALRPGLTAHGPVVRERLPAADPLVRTGDERDLELVAAISRAVRGGSHADEVAFAMSRGAELLVYEERAFAVAQPDYGVWALAGRDEAAATAVLGQALRIGADSDETMRWLTAGQDWAVRVALAAGLRLSAYGALCVRGTPGPLQPYVPSAPFA